MSGRIEIQVPHYMVARDVAEQLNAYLLGARNRQNADGRFGPYVQHAHGERKWQLDESNDYWLHAEDDAGKGAFLAYRYSGEKAGALARLFHAMHE